MALNHQPARPCLVSCGGDRPEAEEPVCRPGTTRSIIPSPVAARAPATRESLNRRGEPVHAARNARDDAREWLLAFETTSSLAVARNCSANNPSADISRRMCRVEIHDFFPSRGAPHFALITAVLGARCRAPPL